MVSSDNFSAPLEHWSSNTQSAPFESVTTSDLVVPPLPPVPVLPSVKDATVELARSVALNRIFFSLPPFRRSGVSTPPSELMASMQRHGFLGALVGRQRGAKIELAFGRRRVQVAQLLNLPAVPVQIRKLDDAAFYWLSLEEAFLQSNLSPLDEALTLAEALRRPVVSIELLAERVGRSLAQLHELLQLVKYPDIEQALQAGLLEVSAALELAKISDKALRTRFLRQWQATGNKPERMVVVSLEPPYKAVAEIASPVATPTKPTKPVTKTEPDSRDYTFEDLQKLVTEFSQQLQQFDLNAFNDNPATRKPARKLVRALFTQLQEADNIFKKVKD